LVGIHLAFNNENVLERTGYGVLYQAWRSRRQRKEIKVCCRLVI